CVFVADCRRSVRSLASCSRSSSTSLRRLATRTSALPEGGLDSQYWAAFAPATIRSAAATAQLAHAGTASRSEDTLDVVALRPSSTGNRPSVRGGATVPRTSLSNLLLAFNRSADSSPVTWTDS